MGCGGGFRFGRLLADIEYGSRLLPGGGYGGYGHSCVEDTIRRELDTLYANGTVTHDEYQDARKAIDAGRFTLDDLWELRQRAAKQNSDNVQAGPDGDELRKTLAQLESKERDLSEARQRTEKVWKELNSSIEDLAKQITRQEELARTALSSDEEEARRHLTRRMELAEQSAGLEGRARELSEEMERLDALSQRIRTRIAEVTALRHRERLARLEAEVLNLPGISDDH